MKRFVLIGLLLAACGNEEKVSPSSATTFMRYFNGGNNDVAVSVLETPDKGLLVLATTEIRPSELVAPHYRIKLIKTDAAGNQVWQRFYPSSFDNDTVSYKAGGMYIKDDGVTRTIAIAGSLVIKTGLPNLLLLTTDILNISDPETEKVDTISIKAPANVAGNAVTVNTAGQFVLVGSISDPSLTKNTLLARIKPTLDSVLWSDVVGEAQVSLSNKVYTGINDIAQEVVFVGGTTYRPSEISIRLMNLVIDPSNPGGGIGNPPLSDVNYQVSGNDFCRYGEFWAFTGGTNEKADGSIGDRDIIFYRVMANDPQLSTATKISYPIVGVGENHDGSGQNEEGNSICVTKEGGLLLLATVNSLGAFGKGGTDYYLIKTDPNGGVLWTKQYGSKFDDNGVQVIQASDGGYIILGTTTFANLKTIMLMKTTSDGSIQ